MPELHDGPDLPLEVQHIWNWYREIELGRSSSGFAPNPIPFSEIQAWSALTGQPLRAFEARLIILLDQLWREAWAKADKARQDFQKAKNTTAQARGGRRHG